MKISFTVFHTHDPNTIEALIGNLLTVFSQLPKDLILETYSANESNKKILDASKPNDVLTFYRQERPLLVFFNRKKTPSYGMFIGPTHLMRQTLGQLSGTLTLLIKAINVFDQFIKNLLIPTIKAINSPYAYVEEYTILQERHERITETQYTIKAERVGIVPTTDGLPGLYFLNFFGKPYIDLFGKEKLLATPAYKVEEIDGGILIQTRESINVRTEEDVRREQQCIEYLGKEAFWSPPNKPATLFPDFGWDKAGRQSEPQLKTEEKGSKTLQDEMKQAAKTCIDAAKEGFGFRLDFSEESIGKIEEMIETGWETSKVPQEIVYVIGAYIGETIKKLLGGEWVIVQWAGEDVVALKGVGKAKQTIFPLDKVYKRFHNGKEDDIVFYYHVMKSGK